MGEAQDLGGSAQQGSHTNICGNALDCRELNSVGPSGAPSPEWVRQMRDHYQRTGGYRSEDLAKLLGDQTQGVGATRTMASIPQVCVGTLPATPSPADPA